VAITAGQVVYLDSATNTFKLADCNSGTAAARVPFGVALDNAAAGQPVQVQTSGPVTIGAAVTPGVGYYLSATPGGICPVADMVAGCFPSFLGFAISATQISPRHPVGGRLALMRAGALDRRITIEVMGPATDDGTRVKPGEWLDLGPAPPQVSPLSGGERIAAGENAAFRTLKFRLRRPLTVHARSADPPLPLSRRDLRHRRDPAAQPRRARGDRQGRAEGAKEHSERSPSSSKAPRSSPPRCSNCPSARHRKQSSRAG
jgi:hypothetical protein